MKLKLIYDIYCPTCGDNNSIYEVDHEYGDKYSWQADFFCGNCECGFDIDFWTKEQCYRENEIVKEMIHLNERNRSGE